MIILNLEKTIDTSKPSHANHASVGKNDVKSKTENSQIGSFHCASLP